MKAIIAINNLGIIGKDGGLPWPRHREDMRHFVAVTKTAPIIVGRVTWESLPPKAQARLAPRTCVVSRAGSPMTEGNPYMQIFASHPRRIFEASLSLELVFGEEPVLIGGAQLYAACERWIDTWIVTRLDDESEGDVRLHPVPWQHMRCAGRQRLSDDAEVIIYTKHPAPSTKASTQAMSLLLAVLFVGIEAQPYD